MKGRRQGVSAVCVRVAVDRASLWTHTIVALWSCVSHRPCPHAPPPLRSYTFWGHEHQYLQVSTGREFQVGWRAKGCSLPCPWQLGVWWCCLPFKRSLSPLLPPCSPHNPPAATGSLVRGRSSRGRWSFSGIGIEPVSGMPGGLLALASLSVAPGAAWLALVPRLVASPHFAAKEP